MRADRQASARRHRPASRRLPGTRSRFTWLEGTRAERVRLAFCLVMVGAIALLGGAARADVPGLVILRPLVVVLAAASLLTPGPLNSVLLRWPGRLLAALAATMALQLVPLPP